MKYKQILLNPLPVNKIMIDFGPVKKCVIEKLVQLELIDYDFYFKMQDKLLDYGINIELIASYTTKNKLRSTSCTLKTNNGHILSYINRQKGFWL